MWAIVFILLTSVLLTALTWWWIRSGARRKQRVMKKSAEPKSDQEPTPPERIPDHKALEPTTEELLHASGLYKPVKAPGTGTYRVFATSRGLRVYETDSNGFPVLA